MGLGSWFQDTVSRPVRRIGGLPVQSDIPSAPDAIDPQQAADAQAKANRYNIQGPFGNVTWAKDQYGRDVQQQQLSPGQATAFNWLGGAMASPMVQPTQTTPTVPGMVPHATAPNMFQNYQAPDVNFLTGNNVSQFSPQNPADTQRYEQAIFDRASNIFNPQFDRQREQLQQRLANQGLPTGSGA